MASFDLCSACFTDLPQNRNCCQRCGISLNIHDELAVYCGGCLTSPPYFDQAIIPYQYDQSIPFIVTQLKYHQRLQHARLMASLMLKAIQNSLDTLPELLIPVPLHPKRYRERGFNQALEIARHISTNLKIELAYLQCERNRDTPHQTGLNAEQRQKNLQRAFSVVKPLNVSRVAILDDVVTTGTTVNTLAKALKNHGIRRVDIWAFARA